MKLVLAEKPSVAQSLAKVLGVTNRQDGYLEGNGYIVSWCVGHLVELAQPEAYDERYGKWTYGDLPILPDDWKYEVSAGTRKQFGILKKLMARDDVVSLVCATDAGREGELIFRLVYHKAGCRKPFERLWISSMEDSAIREGFENLRSGTEYDALYEAALCRERADWIVGINAILTMIESVKYTGTMVNHIRESRFIRDKNQRRVPKEEWYVRENAHEAIVTKDEYEQAQEAIQRRRKFVRSSHDQSDRVYFCAHCGGKLEKANGTVFACPSHRYHDGSPCENVRWRKSALEEIVFEALKRQIEIVSVESAAVRKTAKSKGESLERQLVLLKAQYDACDREKFTIYENYREGKLTPEEYLSGKDALAQKQAALKEQLETCETQLEVFHQQSLDAEEQHEAASRMTGLSDDKLREHLYDAVERVLVYDTETIEIVWKFNESKIDTDENIGVAN